MSNESSATTANAKVRPFRADATPKRGLAWKLTLIGLMYLCQAIPMGFVFGSAPVILRCEHVPLRYVGMLFVLHLPWAAKLFYASYIDKYSLPGFGRRKTWIAPAQFIASGLFYWLASFSFATDFLTVFLLLLAYAVVMATSDIAVDGYATDILGPQHAHWGATLQACGRYVGMMLGAGVLLSLYASLGWPGVCHVMAASLFCLGLPILLHRELSPVLPAAAASAGEAPAGALALLREPGMLSTVAVLVLPTVLFFCGVQMRLPLMTDLGLDAGTLSAALMWAAYPAGFLGTLACGWLLGRLGSPAFMRLFCLGSLAVTAATAWFAAAGTIVPWQAAILLACDNILIGAANVWAFTRIMRVSAGAWAGTGVAVLGSLFILPPLALAPAVGALGDRVGLPTLYAALAAGMFVFYAATEGLVALAKKRQLRVC
ncbi:MFS transporter [Solidesulfovibrio sp.]|uniref:MFS transporter n=1 Tax=Solidesulfovibrio sp. TaxID=2910990 RepID=UPI002B1ED8DC|nr:MFS transporter [Solidesulfovibrio sp.]MEA5088601.1 MFS transporter [Solidesulfovibrio sp.]